MLIDKGANVNAVGNDEQDYESTGCPTVHNRTHLCAAIQCDSCNIFKLLLNVKAV